MRPHSLKFALLAMVLATPLVSRADNFVLTEGASTLTFSLPASPVVQSNGSYFQIDNVTITSGTNFVPGTTLYFDESGNIALQFADGEFPYGIHASGAAFSGVMFTGGTANPTFVAKDYNVTYYPSLTDYYTNTDGVAGTVDIIATPEPSSLLLLGTGLAGLAGAARRKFSK